MIYNFRTIDVEELDLNRISEDNPLKLVFKIAKRLLDINVTDKEIFTAKIELYNELANYDKVKTIDQRKALTYFLEYLFLIQDNSLSEKFKEIKNSIGGGVKMGIDEIREIYLQEKGKLEGIEEGKKEGIEEGKKEGIEEGKKEGIEIAKKIFKLSSQGKSIKEISEICMISEAKVKEILE